MPYREDLDAAIARASAFEEELAEARRELETARARIAELERELACAPKRDPERAPEPKQPAGASAKRGSVPAWVWVSGVVLLIGGIGGWGIWRTLRPPPKIDVSATIADAQATARARFSDAVLASISAKYVDPSGIDDLAHNGRVEYRFVSPSRAALPPAATTVGLPHDNSQDPVCGVEIEFRVFMQGAGSATNDLRGGACTVPLAHPPSCTVAQVWAEAIRRGAPNNAIATYLRLEPNDRGEPTWTLEVDPVFRGELPDRCPFPQR